MRERFELCSKVIGLVLACYGIVISLGFAPTFLHEPDVVEMYGLPPLGPQARESLERANAYTWQWCCVHLLLSGIAPLLLGIYLMRSNNLAVRFCYPIRSAAPAAPAAGEAPGTPPRQSGGGTSAADRDDDLRFAPPGYSA